MRKRTGNFVWPSSCTPRRPRPPPATRTAQADQPRVKFVRSAPPGRFASSTSSSPAAAPIFSETYEGGRERRAVLSQLPIQNATLKKSVSRQFSHSFLSKCSQKSNRKPPVVLQSKGGHYEALAEIYRLQSYNFFYSSPQLPPVTSRTCSSQSYAPSGPTATEICAPSSSCGLR